MIPFQSYLSPIQTSVQMIIRSEIFSFNPTLVQFKHTNEGDIVLDNCTFNPTLVQFKLAVDSSAEYVVENFQSYLSPIQTHHLTILYFYCSISFNPTLVQFKLYMEYEMTLEDEVFQSYLSPIQTHQL